MTRRTALASIAAAPLAMNAASAATNRPTLCIFSKHMAQFNYADLAKNAKQIGFEGVDLTVRAKGHVEPENAARDLPKAYEAIRAAGLEVPMITTGLLNTADPAARPTISTAAKLKIPFWKPGYWRYTKLDIPGNVEKIFAGYKSDLAGLAALSKEHGVTCGVHNHSGDYCGAPVWDTRDAIANLDPKSIGYYLDPAHATIEGGLGNWRITMNLVAPRLKMVALKDFYWTRDTKTGKSKQVWCPIGEGFVDWPKVFANLKAANFTGPLTLHVEYETKDEVASIAKDFEFVKKQAAAVWGA